MCSNCDKQDHNPNQYYDCDLDPQSFMYTVNRATTKSAAAISNLTILENYKKINRMAKESV